MIIEKNILYDIIIFFFNAIFNNAQWPYDGRNLLTLALFSGTHW